MTFPGHLFHCRTPGMRNAQKEKIFDRDYYYAEAMLRYRKYFKVVETMRIHLLKILSLLIIAGWNVHMPVYAQAAETPFNNIISFTTQNSVKLEVIFNELPVANTTFDVKIIDNKSDKNVFDQPVTANYLIHHL